jgi:Uma2 family endonuclease
MEDIIMAPAILTPHLPGEARLPPLPEEDLPILYQEEEDDGMGEANLHTLWAHILFHGLKAHLAKRPELRVYTNLNLYYRKRPLHPKTKSRPNVAADTMVVQPFTPLPEDVQSYTIAEDGPAPLLAAEVLSKGTARKRDLNQKLEIYAALGVDEYLLADPTGRFLAERLLLKRLQHDRTWKDERDPDGGITSRLGFRIVLEADGNLRVVDVATGRRFIRPSDADQRVCELEAEIQRLRRSAAEAKTNGGKKSSRRRKP